MVSWFFCLVHAVRRASRRVVWLSTERGGRYGQPAGRASGIEGDPERVLSAIATAGIGAAPASGLVDLILVDEASQPDHREWMRVTQSILEQPHSSYVLAVADFQ